MDEKKQTAPRRNPKQMLWWLVTREQEVEENNT